METDAPVVESALDAAVHVHEPELTRRGIVGARVAVAVLTAESLHRLTPDEARRLANALVRGAERAEHTDAVLLPLLEKYVEERDRLYDDEAPR